MMLFLPFAMAAIQVDGELVAGQEVILHVFNEEGGPAAGETVRVTHTPSLPSSVERAINISDARGRVVWTPEHSGVAEVRAGSQSHRMRIRPAGPPPAALSILTILFLLSFGMVAFGIRRRSNP